MIIVAGAGALGSHFIQFMRNSPLDIKVIDFDRVESKNVASQFHSKTGVGKNKTVSLVQTFQFLFGKKIESNPNKITQDNIDTVFGGAKIVVDCLDNGPSRKLIQQYVRKNSIPCLHGALAADGALGRVVWDDNFVIDDSAEGAATCHGGDHLPFIAMVSAYMARSVQQFIQDSKKLNFQVMPLAGTIRL